MSPLPRKSTESLSLCVLYDCGVQFHGFCSILRLVVRLKTILWHLSHTCLYGALSVASMQQIPKAYKQMAYVLSYYSPLAKVVAAIVKGSDGTRKRYSAHVICQAILKWYHDAKLCPRGISTKAASVHDWALRVASASRKMVSCIEKPSLEYWFLCVQIGTCVKICQG